MRSLRVLLFIFIPCILFLSCGKKGDPTLKSYEMPDSPSGLTAIHRESEIILLWDFPKSKEQTLKGFHLMKSTGEDFEKIAFIEKDKRSYMDEDFNVGSEYEYKIISQNFKGVMSIDSNIVEVAPKSPPPPPGRPSFTIEHDSLTLTWEDVGEDILYNVYKSSKRGHYSLHPLNREPIEGTSFRDSFDVKKSIYYTIRSLRGGGIRDEGPASEELEINPSDFVPSPPEGLQAVTTEERIYLNWKDAPEKWVIGFRIYREIDREEGYVLIGETQTPSFVDEEKLSMKRNYRVTAIGPLTEGPPSEIRDVVFIPNKYPLK